jgi:hypothetical protein
MNHPSQSSRSGVIPTVRRDTRRLRRRRETVRPKQVILRKMLFWLSGGWTHRRLFQDIRLVRESRRPHTADQPGHRLSDIVREANLPKPAASHPDPPEALESRPSSNQQRLSDSVLLISEKLKGIRDRILQFRNPSYLEDHLGRRVLSRLPSS